MPLVEIIVGEECYDVTLTQSFDYVLQIGQTSIVVNDLLSFYTSGVVGTDINESLVTVIEGINPRSIAMAGVKAGISTIIANSLSRYAGNLVTGIVII